MMIILSIGVILFVFYAFPTSELFTIVFGELMQLLFLAVGFERWLIKHPDTAFMLCCKSIRLNNVSEGAIKL